MRAPTELAGLIKRLFDEVTINTSTPNPANPAANIDHSSHFFLGGENLDARRSPAECRAGGAVGVVPTLASSSGGFTFGVSASGEVVPTSTTFGPLFAERGVTIGRKQVQLRIHVPGNELQIV